MAPDGYGNGAPALTGRARRKAKQKAKANGQVFEDPPPNPYSVLADDDAGDTQAATTSEPEMHDFGTKHPPTDDSRPKTSSSGGSAETLVDSKPHDTGVEEDAPATTTRTAKSAHVEERVTPREWEDDVLDTNTDTPYMDHEPLSPEAQAKEDIRFFLKDQKGHHWTLKQTTYTKLADFVYGLKYRSGSADESEQAKWVAELRCVVWRAVVRANFWWVNPVSAPFLHHSFVLGDMLTCAGHRRSHLPRPAYLGPKRNPPRPLRTLRHLRSRAPRPRRT